MYFYVYVDNHLTVNAVGDTDRYVALNATETLEVSASCLYGEDNLQYQWYKGVQVYDEEDDETYTHWQDIDGANASKYVIDAVKERARYWCEVSDVYGNTRNVWFYITCDN